MNTGGGEVPAGKQLLIPLLSTQLPDGFEMKLDDQNRPYYIDHNNKTSSYNDPRLGTQVSSPPNQYVGQQNSYQPPMQQQHNQPPAGMSYAQKGQYYAQQNAQQNQVQLAQYQPPQAFQQPQALAPGQLSVACYGQNGISVGMTNPPVYEGLPELSAWVFHEEPFFLLRSGDQSAVKAKDGVFYNVDNKYSYGPNLIPIRLTEKYIFQKKRRMKSPSWCEGYFPTKMPPFIELQQRIHVNDYENALKCANDVMERYNFSVFNSAYEKHMVQKQMCALCVCTAGLCFPCAVYGCLINDTCPAYKVDKFNGMTIETAMEELDKVLIQHDKPGLKIRAMKAHKQFRQRVYGEDDSTEYFFTKFQTIELKIMLQ